MRLVRCLVADPPWHFGDSLPGKSRGASKNYSTMDAFELGQFKLPPLADDAVLFMWRVSAMGDEAYGAVREWGFTPKSEIVWLKKTTTDKRWLGMGRYVRMEHESCLIAVRGKPKIKLRNVRSTFEAPAGRHSEKPEAFFDIVESMYDGPYAELFARRRRPGWSCYGNEL